MAEDNIVKQLHLCAMLMSDPLTMRNFPSVVANQFYVALGAIETLRVHLRRPENVGAWLDEKVLDAGIVNLVRTLIAKLLEPLSENMKWPVIFEKDFKNAGGVVTASHIFEDDVKENLLKREIKETNAVSVLLLLYYYLYWHLVLIAMNDNSNANSFSGKSGLDFKKLVERIPKFTDLFEFRYLKTTKSTDIEIKTELVNDFFDFDGNRVRNSGLVAYYCAVLHFLHSKKDSGNKYFVDNLTHLEGLLKAFELFKPSEMDKFDISKSDDNFVPENIRNIVFTDPKIFAEIFSVFGSHDPTQKWIDMYNYVEVISSNTDKSNKNTMKFTHRLIDILLKHPFCDDRDIKMKIMKGLCVMDYNCSTIMMDVVESCARLKLFFRKMFIDGGGKESSDTNIFSSLFRQVFRVGWYDKADNIVLSDLRDHVGGGQKHTKEIKSFISPAINNVRMCVDLKDTKFITKRMFELASYYWGAAGKKGINQYYYAWPWIPNDDESIPLWDKIFAIYQSVAEDKKEQAKIDNFVKLITQGRKNTLFVSSFYPTVLNVLAGTENHPLLTQDKAFKDSLSKKIAQELKALDECRRSAKRFNRVAGFSWPVKFLEGGETKNNIEGCFREGDEVVPRIRSVIQSVDTIATNTESLGGLVDAVALIGQASAESRNLVNRDARVVDLQKELVEARAALELATQATKDANSEIDRLNAAAAAAAAGGGT
jgi:hypothetical protein